MIPQQALCTNFIEPTIGTMVDIAGIIQPTKIFSYISRELWKDQHPGNDPSTHFMIPQKIP